MTIWNGFDYENILFIPFIGRNGLLQSFSSAIDAAIWDLRGKILNLPVYKLFQDYVSSKEVYISGGSVILSPDEIEKDIPIANSTETPKATAYCLKKPLFIFT